MPTPLGHFTIAQIIYKSKQSLSLPALIIGSIIPDLGIFFNFITKVNMWRDLLHSVIGVGTLGTLISTTLVVLFYPIVVSTFFRIDKKEIGKVCSLSKNVLISSLIGCLSHVLIDSTCHDYNPLFYPFTKQSVDIFLLTSNWKFSYFLVEFLLFVLLVILIANILRKGIRGFWKQILVGAR